MSLLARPRLHVITVRRAQVRLNASHASRVNATSLRDHHAMLESRVCRGSSTLNCIPRACRYFAAFCRDRVVMAVQRAQLKFARLQMPVDAAVADGK